MNKPYSAAPLSDFHLRIGLLVTFVNEVNRGVERKDMNPMGNLYVFDDRAEIHTPKECPENWPTGFIRIYSEQAKSTADTEWTLRNFDPAHNSAGYDAKRGGSLDQQGIRFLTGLGGFYGCGGHYMVVPEFEQLSFIPFIGDHKDSPEKLLEESKLGGYDRKVVLAAFEEAKVKEEYTEDEMEHFGAPHTYTNWILLNALIISKVVSLRAIALSQHGDNVMREQLERDSRTGAPLPVDVSVADPVAELEHKVDIQVDPLDPAPDVTRALIESELKAKPGDHDGDRPL